MNTIKKIGLTIGLTVLLPVVAVFSGAFVGLVACGFTVVDVAKRWRSDVRDLWDR